MITTTLLCPYCNQEINIKIIKRNGEYIAVPFLNTTHSPTVSELEKIGIELGIINEEGGERK